MNSFIFINVNICEYIAPLCVKSVSILFLFKTNVQKIPKLKNLNVTVCVSEERFALVDTRAQVYSIARFLV